MSLRNLFDLSPAMRRYLRRSWWAIPSGFIAGWSAAHLGQSAEGSPLGPRIALIVVVILAMVWAFLEYTRFLREADELERRQEVLSLVWAAGAAMTSCVGLMMLELAHIWKFEVIGALQIVLLVTVGVQVLVRALLHWRYQ